MANQINDLVEMKDIETLYELMMDGDDPILQLDAAEGLVKLGDRRGLEYLLIAKESDLEDVQEVTREILADPDIKRMREQIEAEMRFDSQKLVEGARERLKQGKKVFLHKVIRLSAADFDQASLSGEAIQIYDLNDAGLQGWEVVNVMPRRQLVGPGEPGNLGAFVFLQKELASDEAEELDGK